MQCDDIRELMSAHVDGCLDPAGEKRLSAHLAACPACRQDLAALECTVQALHALPPVVPPSDLAVRIRRRVREAQTPRPSRIIAFLSLPQTRVALAASLLVVLTVLGLRQMNASPRPVRSAELPGTACDAREALVAAAPAPLPATAPAAPLKGAQPFESSIGDRPAGGARAVSKSAEKPVAAARPSAPPRPPQEPADALQLEQAQTAGGGAGPSVAQPRAAARQSVGDFKNQADKTGMAVKAPGGMAVNAVAVDELQRKETAPDPDALGTGNGLDRQITAQAPPRLRTAEQENASLRRGLSDGYTFRTARIAEAAAIVNRHARAPAADAAAAVGQVVAETKQDDDRTQPSPVTVEVALAPGEIPALLEELRQAGALLVVSSAAGEKKREVGAAAGHLVAADAAVPMPETRGSLGFSAARAPAAVAPGAAPAAAPAPAAAMAKSAGSAPARVVVRFTFLPPAP